MKPPGQKTTDLMVLLALAGLVAWYLFDSLRASASLLNLIMVLPVAATILVLCAVEFVTQSRGGGAQAGAAEKADAEEKPAASPVAAMLLFVPYVLTLPWLGFDIGTFLFVTLFLYLHGERRLHWAAGYSLCFSLASALLFSWMLPYPMPMLVLPTAY